MTFLATARAVVPKGSGGALRTGGETPGPHSVRRLSIVVLPFANLSGGGNRLRVNVQLIDVETGHHLWAERFDKPITDLFDMQDEIVSMLANTLNAQLIEAEARRAERAVHPGRDVAC
jgi:TolB-like protein